MSGALRRHQHHFHRFASVVTTNQPASEGIECASNSLIDMDHDPISSRQGRARRHGVVSHVITSNLSDATLDIVADMASRLLLSRLASCLTLLVSGLALLICLLTSLSSNSSSLTRLSLLSLTGLTDFVAFPLAESRATGGRRDTEHALGYGLYDCCLAILCSKSDM